MTKKVAFTGATGLVGSRVVELWPNKNLTSVGSELDLTNKDAVKEWLSATEPDFLVNFAAYTNVSLAENDKDAQTKAIAINVTGLQNLIDQVDSKTQIIQISTDMVFSGRSGPYSENDQVEPDDAKITFYGRTKRDAEKLLDLSKSTILRIVYPVRASFPKKSDYLRYPISLLKENKLYPLFTDQNINFTFIDELATVLQKIIDSDAKGIFHAACHGTFSPYELISYTAEKLNLDISQIKKATIAEFLSKQTNPYRYPIDGGLLTDQTEKKLGLSFHSWEDVVDLLIAQGL